MIRPITSASNLFRRKLCPKSASLEAGLPEDESEQSREGVLLHDYYAHPEFDRSMLKPNQRDLVELADTLTSVAHDRIKRSVVLGEAMSIRETTISMADSMFMGTPDLLYWWKEDKTIWINDVKFGYNTVDRADVNMQLRAYAVMGYDYTDQTARKTFVSITQPRVSYEERITLAEYMPEDIEASRHEIAAILKMASEPDAPLHASEEACRYCKAKLICPEFRKAFSGPLSEIKPEVGLSKAAREAYLESRLQELDDDQFEKVLIACAMAAMVKPLAHEEARRRIQKGELTNYVLSKPSEVREIADTQRAISLLTLAGIRTREQLLAIASIPLGGIEEDYRKQTGCTWKEARDKLNKVLASVIETEERKPRVMRK